MIRFKAVKKRYQEKLVLKRIDLDILSGEFLVLVGPSGSGKTTILKMINRLIEPSDGEIFINNQPIKLIDKRSLRLDMGYVLQQIALFPNMTVSENIELIPEMKKMPKSDRVILVAELLDKVGLKASEYATRYPRELSGGEQQRVGILRAIIGKPKVLLMDEPFSALDPISREQLQDLILSLQREFEMTTVFVTHDTDEAIALADRIAVLHNGELVQLASPDEILKNPASPFVATLFGGTKHD